ncbi:hypothetical protein HPB48_005854 [Haemaphysalis longicornis]|uniref:Uncharacterized protein n=1 Tax=Haemaphysalis longicornis TaxID=44386 RepID=A0A9J6GMM2_HAELO|nr:hypothetical protein HPB48_005854 [Haemaphysalis longicornis]
MFSRAFLPSDDEAYVLVPQPRVLEAWLLFAVAIVGDETTLFWRMCLHALQRCALHMQPLFLFVQLTVLVFSLFLPSSFIAVFGIVLIERFVVTTGKEIIGADQRSGIRAPPTTSSQNMIENLQRPRWPQIAAKVVERRARSVSVASDATMVSAGSGCSSIVRHYKLHPEWQEDHRLDRAKLVCT